jgi:exodeoxyribonuclease VII small subunit
MAEDKDIKDNDNLKDFEKSLQQLEKIVAGMESGELGLQDSLSQFEQGIKLAKTCQDTLAHAELRVEQLIEKNGLQQTVPLEDDED